MYICKYIPQPIIAMYKHINIYVCIYICMYVYMYSWAYIFNKCSCFFTSIQNTPLPYTRIYINTYVRIIKIATQINSGVNAAHKREREREKETPSCDKILNANYKILSIYKIQMYAHTAFTHKILLTIAILLRHMKFRSLAATATSRLLFVGISPPVAACSHSHSRSLYASFLSSTQVWVALLVPAPLCVSAVTCTLLFFYFQYRLLRVWCW